ncbi:MAG: molybdopterin molybdotransferase MoeA [Oscillospiraceae bacterium]|nr:molybdopterin molybdotransferase MoeA [Oscillospiraceae bacterium]
MKHAMGFLEARALLLQKLAPVETERVALADCAGRILAQELKAEENVPAFDRSPYDGYAFRAADTVGASQEAPVTLRILEEVPAGATPTQAVTQGTATKILTGAPIPEGADAVINYERTAFTAETVTLFAPVKSGTNIVRAGEDVKKGTVLLRPGQVVDPGAAGMLAAQGVAQPLVYRRVRVAVLSTGAELVEADAVPQPGSIRNSNAYTLSAALRQNGLEPVYLGIAGDSVEDIAALLRRGLDTCDAVVSTGGVSAGDYDLTPDAMERAGMEVLLHGVDLKPGMACAYAVKDGKPVCALSGNPASSLTNFYAIALPLLKTLAGCADAVPKPIRVTLRNGFSKSSRGTRMLRGRLVLENGAAELLLPEDQGNVVLSSTIGCNAIAIVPHGSGPLPAGTVLDGFLI